MASVIDPAKRKNLLSKGAATYTDREKQLIKEAQENTAAREAAKSEALDTRASRLTEATGKQFSRRMLPEGGEVVAEEAVLEAPSAYTPPYERNPKAVALQKAWEDFRTRTGKGSLEAFRGSSLVDRERTARRNMELDRAERGRLNRYARESERRGQFGSALAFRDEAENELGAPVSNVKTLMQQYLARFPANRAAVPQETSAANPFASTPRPTTQVPVGSENLFNKRVQSRYNMAGTRYA